MSRLKLFWPEDVDNSANEPAILPFTRCAEPRAIRIEAAVQINRGHAAGQELLTRTRAIHDNQCCPVCDRAAVEPLVAKDAWIGRNQRPIPGTATLLGFRCCHCEHRWSA
jgi:hypothetical protein